NASGTSQLVHGRGLRGSATVPFSWTTSTSTSPGNHTLAGSHDLTDDKPANNQASTNVMVNAPPGPNTMHVGDLDATTSSSGNRWSATVEIYAFAVAEWYGEFGVAHWITGNHEEAQRLTEIGLALAEEVGAANLIMRNAFLRGMS